MDRQPRRAAIETVGAYLGEEQRLHSKDGLDGSFIRGLITNGYLPAAKMLFGNGGI